METLPYELSEAVLQRLGFSEVIAPDRLGLEAVYRAWCRSVPFDNLVKRIDLATGTTPFRNDEPVAFFDLWLRHGCGGTCWPSSRALGALLATLGFDTRLASAAMRDDLAGPVPSHGTVIIAFGRELWWVDSSMLTDVPVPLIPGSSTRVDHPLRPIDVEPVADRWRVHWRGGAMDGVLGCLLLDPDVDTAFYSTRYEASRSWSPFNAATYVTTNRDDHVASVAMGRHIVLDADGYHASEPLEPDQQRRLLVEEFGYSEALVDAVPADDPS